MGFWLVWPNTSGESHLSELVARPPLLSHPKEGEVESEKDYKGTKSRAADEKVRFVTVEINWPQLRLLPTISSVPFGCREEATGMKGDRQTSRQ